ncbi:protein of unknown function [Xenorhabdus bovienii]|uniref:Uncharacterized protein n=1 Tax=Xenorhabdus bovienii TaxID=40576 RepID=A0A0B6X2T5_XENBV|nr:protein of unknown function [Xenorhabdus bovienii]
MPKDKKTILQTSSMKKQQHQKDYKSIKIHQQQKREPHSLLKIKKMSQLLKLIYFYYSSRPLHY